MRGCVRAAVGMLVVGVLAFGACAPIEGVPLSTAPLNACTDQARCDRYDLPEGRTKAQCTSGRCEFGRPDYPFTVLVHVPSSSFYAPGRTFALTSNDLNARSGTAARSSCVPPSCIALPELVTVEGKYVVTRETARTLGVGLPDARTSIPVRVEYIPLAPERSEEAIARGLPASSVTMSSRWIRAATGLPPEVVFRDTIAVGRYRRIAYPEPPYDQWFPPVITDSLSVTGPLNDELVLGENVSLDDPTGRRTAVVTRDEGLEGFRTWLVDRETGRRVSLTRALAGTRAAELLHTIGQSKVNEPGPVLRDGIDVVVAPPEGWLGVPWLQSGTANGAPEALGNIIYRSLPTPVSVTGVVAQGEDENLTGVPSRLTFTSVLPGLRQLSGTPTPLLKYATSVSTDNTGHFVTVLPRGFYEVIIEPAEGTGLSSARDTLDTEVSVAKTFRPPPRTLATGRVMLADGRPLAEADVRAVPSRRTIAGPVAKPRPGHARTEADGTFRLELDHGEYDLIVDPEEGSGFPRTLQLRSFSTGTAELGDLVVGPPSRIAFALRDPNQSLNPIVRAVVRVFAELPGRGPPAVEIGQAITDAEGRCEILLAAQNR